MGTYIDDERQSSRPPGPRPAGLVANAPSAVSQQLKGSTDPVFAAAPCSWSVCGQSIQICRRDRALMRHRVDFDQPAVTVLIFGAVCGAPDRESFSGVAASLSTTSSPVVTWPKQVY